MGSTFKYSNFNYLTFSHERAKFLQEIFLPDYSEPSKKRDFRAIPRIWNPTSKHKRLSWTCFHTQTIINLLNRFDGKRECYLQVVDQTLQMPDRLFFDFDYKTKRLEGYEARIVDSGVKNGILKKITKELMKTLQKPLKDAKRLQEYFINEYDASTMLFFSGAHGFHLYVFMWPIRFYNFNKTMTEYSNTLKKTLKLTTLDLAVCKDALVRLARAPYTMNMKTRLYAVHVNPTDTIEDIIKRSLKPQIRDFEPIQYSDGLSENLKQIDDRIENHRKTKIVKKVNKIRIQETEDIRPYIREILGEPARETKKYLQYNCIFHDDKNPSLTIYPTYWKCYGCGAYGGTLKSFIERAKRVKP
ncbi:MAG TPA: CHC2 zinc finger domain-containing protein [Sphingobacteriaceae bacterium]